MEPVLRARASLKKKGMFSSSRLNVQDIAQALLNGTEGTPLEANARARATGPNGPFTVNVHPNVGPVRIRANGDDVEVEARAYTVGPGYHAFLVSVLDSMQSSLGLQWEWLDPTGYAHKRDFAELQSRMAEYFAALCGSLLAQIDSDDSKSGAKIFLPADFGVDAQKDEILTPAGPVSLAQLRHWASIAGRELRTAAATFYMWWDEGFGGSFYRGVVLYWLWMDIRWATPLDSDEADFIIGVLDCYKSALEHHVALPIPPEAITELFALVEGTLPRPIADKNGIGYRRRIWKRPVGRHWWLVMPGSLVPSEEGDDDKPQYVFDARGISIRASCYVAPSDDPEIRAGVFDGEISVIDRYVEKLNKTFKVRSLGRTFPMGERTQVCFLTIATSTPEMGVLGQRVGESLTFVPDGEV